MLSITLLTLISLATVSYTNCADIPQKETQNGESKSIETTTPTEEQWSKGQWSEPGCEAIHEILKSESYANKGIQEIENIAKKHHLNLAQCRENGTGNTLLHHMADDSYGNYFMWPFLVKATSEAINTKDSPKEKHFSSTPLHYAAYKGNLYAVQLLLDHGADPLIKNDLGWTPAKGALVAFTDCYDNYHSNLEHPQWHGIHGRKHYGKILDLLLPAEKYKATKQ